MADGNGWRSLSSSRTPGQDEGLCIDTHRVAHRLLTGNRKLRRPPMIERSHDRDRNRVVQARCRNHPFDSADRHPFAIWRCADLKSTWVSIFSTFTSEDSAVELSAGSTRVVTSVRRTPTWIADSSRARIKPGSQGRLRLRRTRWTEERSSFWLRSKTSRW